MERGFERKTYVDIVDDMQARAYEVFGDNINLGDSSPLGMLIQSTAWEMSVAWDAIEQSYQSGFAYYATGNNLDKVASNAVRKRFEGSQATVYLKFKGSYGTVIPEGFTVSTDEDMMFRTYEEHVIEGDDELVGAISTGVGEAYNVKAGTITEIVNPLSGVEEVTNPQDATDGTDVETDDAFRERYLESMTPLTGDNPAQYSVWAREIPNVGGARILPVTPEPGYTTVLVLNDEGLPASEDLVTSVEEHIIERRPATAGVVVGSVEPKYINISAVVVFDGDVEETTDRVRENISKHFASEAINSTYASFAVLGSIILDTVGVVDYKGLTLNGSTDNIELGEREVPVVGELELIEWK